jgi:hypothetical protein
MQMRRIKERIKKIEMDTQQILEYAKLHFETQCRLTGGNYPLRFIACSKTLKLKAENRDWLEWQTDSKRFPERYGTRTIRMQKSK